MFPLGEGIHFHAPLALFIDRGGAHHVIAVIDLDGGTDRARAADHRSGVVGGRFFLDVDQRARVVGRDIANGWRRWLDTVEREVNGAGLCTNIANRIHRSQCEAVVGSADGGAGCDAEAAVAVDLRCANHHAVVQQLDGCYVAAHSRAAVGGRGIIRHPVLRNRAGRTAFVVVEHQVGQAACFRRQRVKRLRRAGRSIGLARGAKRRSLRHVEQDGANGAVRWRDGERVNR
ncbi:hypothetical protein SDC9_100195 [bioreactor metagenome]|uniref:Uncharacterized protein n=1 Tax=bioreactor metagenome TaxID=1076179 RepID=A0A645AK68_9ZZZZ